MSYVDINMSIAYTLMPAAVIVGVLMSMFLYFCGKAAIYGVPRTQRIEEKGGSVFLPKFFMEYWNWVIAPVQKVAVKVRVLSGTGVVVTGPGDEGPASRPEMSLRAMAFLASRTRRRRVRSWAGRKPPGDSSRRRPDRVSAVTAGSATNHLCTSVQSTSPAATPRSVKGVADYVRQRPAYGSRNGEAMRVCYGCSS